MSCELVDSCRWTGSAFQIQSASPSTEFAEDDDSEAVESLVWDLVCPLDCLTLNSDTQNAKTDNTFAALRPMEARTLPVSRLQCDGAATSTAVPTWADEKSTWWFYGYRVLGALLC